ncbi:MAG: hypothetical protein KDD38_10490, partial [Bdellovibrionales bacterium]|nr:hypothetical protein [Bdellovibrionales bacterium]
MKLSSRVQAFLKTLSLSVLLFSFFRIIFYLTFMNTSQNFTFLDALRAFFIGLRFDIRLSLLLSLPILLFSLFKRIHWARSDFSRKFWASAYALIFLSLLFTYAGDLGYYAYLRSRINARIFEFFNNFLISAEMVYESYNVWAWSIGLVILTFVIYKILYFFVFTHKEDVFNKKKVRVFQSLALTFAIIIGLHGSS